MTQTAKAQEPSMEEILASIRRIIADDDAKPAKGPTSAPETAPPAKQPAAAAPATPPAPPAKPAAPPAPKSATSPAMPAAAANSQDEIDAMLAELDGPPKATPKPAASPEAPDVLDLTEAMTSQTPPPGPAPSFRTIDANPDVVFASKPEPASPVPDRGLISSETVKAVDSAFNTLAHTVIGQNARTLEDLVREMLRPMLKSWLDDNLPGLVERIVRAEIERVSRGRP
jgi:cell pole-organizing protein PopZ